MTDFFISYSTIHPIYVEMIENVINQEGFTYWRDRNNLIGGGDWKPAIEKGIQESHVIIVIITSEAVESTIVKYEVEFAKSLHKPRIPLIFSKYDNITVPLSILGLSDKQAINYPEFGLVVANEKLRKCLWEFGNQWKPIQENIDKLNHYSEHVRESALLYLGDTNDFRVIPYVLGALRDEDSTKNQRVIYQILGNFESEVVITKLIENFENLKNFSHHDQLRHTILRSLLKLSKHDPQIIEQILYWLQVHDHNIKSICNALLKVDEVIQERAMKILLERLDVKNLDEYPINEQRQKRTTIRYVIEGLSYFPSQYVVDSIEKIASSIGTSEKDQQTLRWGIVRVKQSRYWKNPDDPT